MVNINIHLQNHSIWQALAIPMLCIRKLSPTQLISQKKTRIDLDLSGGFKAEVFLLYPPQKEKAPQARICQYHSYILSEFELHVTV